MDYLKKADPNWSPSIVGMINDYVKTGKMLFVYRDFPFLGTESFKSAEAAMHAVGRFHHHRSHLFHR
jgi:hypothetical protein